MCRVCVCERCEDQCVCTCTGKTNRREKSEREQRDFLREGETDQQKNILEPKGGDGAVQKGKEMVYVCVSVCTSTQVCRYTRSRQY